MGKNSSIFQDIDKQYKKLCPSYHKKQWKEARKTPYFIPKTAFSTLTLNLLCICHILILEIFQKDLEI